MTEIHFVKKGSIVREIWGKSDTILLIFAGAAAEFALNKSVDWLYFTGKLPKDPIGRLFSTVSYARRIVFSPNQAAMQAIDTINAIHAGVENRRGLSIPVGAYRDVLYMLIDYSIRSYEVLERKMNQTEKQEVFEVFSRLGQRMTITDLPHSYEAWVTDREVHMEENLQHSYYTDALFHSYRSQLNAIRYWILLESQKLIVPEIVRKHLGYRKFSIFKIVIPLYKITRKGVITRFLRGLILPSEYHQEIRRLDVMK